MEYWIIYHVATGELLIRGSGERGSAAQQQLPDGTAIIAVPQKVVAQPEIDLAALRAACIYSVDVEAEAARGRFLTAGSGQAMTYTRKETEARAWTADNSIATPFLSAEANARGLTLADLIAEVIGQADAWVTIGAAIEARRMGAKAAIAAAATFGGIVAARNIDWSALDAAAGA
ncbi:hypothetical protein [Sphingomonas phyllosphaerae]|uniref:hypothetical protein n=1 Tax=Sphingomonas phyllosphaerae TaxID=257003 RepID=UPI00042365F8|nr:hypothetical protein [Sphingomonas phyllosphaerae]